MAEIVTLVGEVFRDVQTERDRDGREYRRFTVRVSGWDRRQKQRQDRYWECTAFGDVWRPGLDRVVRAGAVVTVCGVPELEIYTGRDGQPRLGRRLVASSVAFVTYPQQAPVEAKVVTTASDGADAF